MSKPQQILDLNPPNELVFEGPFTEVITTKLTLTNPSNEIIGFKVKTTAPKQYCVRPNSGVISPHNSQTVSVMLQPMDEQAKADRAKHKFMVQALCVEEGFSVEELDTKMKAAGKGKLMDSKLKCTFIEPTDSSNVMEGGQSDPVVDPEAESMVSVQEDNVRGANVEATPEVTQSMTQPTAGSTPAHTSTAQNIDNEVEKAELRTLRERVKKVTDENKALKSDVDRMRQQILSRTTAVPLRPGQGPAQQQNTPINLIIVLVILAALVSGFFIGAYLH